MIAASSWNPGLAGALALAVPSASAADDIRDVRPPIPLPTVWLAIAIGVAVVAVAVLALVTYRAWRRRAVRPLSPQERALRALDDAASLGAEGRAHAWADLVAATLREALSSRLDTPVTAPTTRELSEGPWLRDPRLAHAGAERLLDLLGVCDAARFAKGRFEPGALAASTGLAREWVVALFTAAPEATVVTDEDAPPTQRSATPPLVAPPPRGPSPASPSEVAR